MPENEPGRVQRPGIKERELLLYGPFQRRARLPVRERVMGKVHMEPRPCGPPLLRLHVVPARHHDKGHVLPDPFLQVFRMNPVLRVVRMAVVTVHHIHIAGEEIIPAPAAVPKLRAHMVKRHHLHAVILIVNDPPVGIQAVLRVPLAVRRVKCHPHALHTSSQSSVK